jgi:large subunit ribosomal protein L4
MMEVENRETAREPIKLPVLDRGRNEVETMDLDPVVFGAEVKRHLLHEVVVYQEARHREGNACTKTRGEVAGSNKKPFRQKGTGRARQGERRSPVMTGGGVAFGPKPRDFSIKVTKKVRKSALRSALSARREEGRLILVDDLKLERIKTGDLVAWLKGLEIAGNALVVIAAADQQVELSARNLPRTKVIRAEGINVRDILLHEHLVLTKAAALQIQEALS